VATPRPAPHPLIPAVGAVVVAGVLVVVGVLHVDVNGENPLLVAAIGGVGIAGLLTTLWAVAERRAGRVGWAVAVLAAEYAISVIAGRAALDAEAPLVGVGLLLVAELSHTACEWRGPHAVDTSVELRRWARLAAAGVAGAVAGGGALALAGSVRGSVPGLLVGAAGVVGLVGLAAWLRRSTSDETLPAA
jgi:hypothetical protein